MSLRFTALHAISALGVFAAAAVNGYGQEYPNKPIRIVTTEAGAGLDFISRYLSQNLSEALGQQLVVDNRGGAGGALAIDQVAKSLPDGYTLLVTGSALWLLPYTRKEASWDPLKDFAPISTAGSSPNVIVVHPSLPVKSISDLIALAKARPGELNYGSGGLGSNNYLVAESFKAVTKTNIVHVPYKGAAPAFIGLIGGQVQLMFPSAGSAITYLKSGKLKGLAVTSARPSPLVPGLPTLAATVPGFESISSFAIFAPAKTNAAVVNRLNQEITKLLKAPDTQSRFLGNGMEASGSTPDQVTALMKTEMLRMGKVIKDAGITAN